MRGRNEKGSYGGEGWMGGGRLALRVIVLRRGVRTVRCAGLWLWRRTGGDSLGGHHARFGFISGCFPLVLGLVTTSLLTVIVVFSVLKVLVLVCRYGRNSLGGRRRCGGAKCRDDWSNWRFVVVFTDGSREGRRLVVGLVSWLVGLMIGGRCWAELWLRMVVRVLTWFVV